MARKQEASEAAGGLTVDERQRLRQLERENRVLKMERDIFKKSDGVLREGERVKFSLIETERKSFPVRALCRVLNVTAGGFYAWLKRPESTRVTQDRALRVHVRAAFQRSNRTYGSPRVQKDLKKRLTGSRSRASASVD